MIGMYFTGRLGRNAELRTARDTEVCGFSVATDIGYGERKRTFWIECAIFGERGQKLAPHLLKGKMVAIQGTPDVRAYTKGPDAIAVQQCRVNTLDFIGPKDEGQQHQSPKDYGLRPELTGGGPGMDDEIPFAPEWR